MTELEFHPLANIFPLMEGEAFASLVADIRDQGLEEPVVLLDGKILDGRNRYRACREAGVEYRCETYTGSDPLGYVISKNLHRRHLDESQRAMVAAKLATLRDGQRADLVEGLPIGRASELLNVGERSVARARGVQEHGTPELVQAVERGNVKVSAAADIATESLERQREILAQGEDQILAAAKAIRARRAEQSHAARIEKLARIAGANLPTDQRFPVVRVLTGDCRDVLRTLPDASVHCVVTSPPYWGLRDYGTAKWEGGDLNCDHSGAKINGRSNYGFGDKSRLQISNISVGYSRYRQQCDCGAVRIDSQIGQEGSLADYIETMRGVFRDVRRVLRDDGTLWLNMGDCHARDTGNGLKPKDLCGIPWRLAFALQGDGWYLRSEIIWAKSNPMPESVTDRPTKAHETIFLMSKSERYFYDIDAIREPHIWADDPRNDGKQHFYADDAKHNQVDPDMQRIKTDCVSFHPNGRNKRTVWEIATEPFPGAHFATFPKKLIEPCIKAGCPHKCCAKCGAPWVREVEREPSDWADPKAAGEPTRHGLAPAAACGAGGFKGKSAETIGFSPSCSCNADTVPGTVLDPFGGAGTTGLVATRLHRDAILIELNPDYAVMAEARIRDDALLLVQIASDHQTDRASA
jgi:DNA modification methylase